MTFKTASLAAGAALLALTPAAFAADMPISAPPVEAFVPERAGFDWTGFYVGVYGGYAFGETDVNDTTVTYSTDSDGGLFGGTIGYNQQFGNLVAGIEADGGWAGIESDENVLFETNIDWTATVRGRLGFAFDSFMVYGTAGLAMGGVEHVDTLGFVQDDTLVGWTAGAGVEAALTDNISAKVEYLYLDLGEETFGADDVDFSAHTVRAGLNYRF